MNLLQLSLGVTDEEKNNAVVKRTLYEKYRVSWFMICLRQYADGEEAEDMMQESIISILKFLKHMLIFADSALPNISH